MITAASLGLLQKFLPVVLGYVVLSSSVGVISSHITRKVMQTVMPLKKD